MMRDDLEDELKHPCERGFKCPHKGYTEDGEPLCIAPYTREHPPRPDDDFPLIGMALFDCPMDDTIDDEE